MNDGTVPQNVAPQPRGPLQGANGMISLMHRPQIRQGGRSGGLLQNMGALRLPLALIRAAGGGGSGGGGGFLEAIHNFQESVGGVGRMFGGAQELFAGGLGDFFSGGVGDLLDGGLGDIIGGFMDI